MQLRVLGCSGGVGKGLRTTSYLLDQHILLDGGTGVGELSIEEMRDIRHVVLTHAHLDHVTGFALMLSSIYDSFHQTINVYAPAPVIAALKNSLFNWQVWPDFSQLPSEESPIIRFQTITEGNTFNIDDYSFEAILLSHTVESYAYLIIHEQSHLCFFGDTGPTDKIWQRINETGIEYPLIVEVSYPNDNTQLAADSGHYTAELLAKDLQKLNYPPHVYVQHLKPGVENGVISQCNVAFNAYKTTIIAHNTELMF